MSHCPESLSVGCFSRILLVISCCALFSNGVASDRCVILHRVNPVHHISHDLLLLNEFDHLDLQLLDNVV